MRVGNVLPKLGMQPVRKRQLIAAAIDTLHRYGWQDTTVARIGQAAGLSPGIIHHYFASKDELLAAAMRQILVEFRAEVNRRLEHAVQPRDRLVAVIDGCFDASQFQPGVGAAWLAFWAQAPFAPALDRLRRLYLSRLRSTLAPDLRELVGASELDAAALSLGSLIDGLFLRAASGDGAITPEVARALTVAHLDRMVGTARCR